MPFPLPDWAIPAALAVCLVALVLHFTRPKGPKLLPPVERPGRPYTPITFSRPAAKGFGRVQDHRGTVVSMRERRQS